MGLTHCLGKIRVSREGGKNKLSRGSSLSGWVGRLEKWWFGNSVRRGFKPSRKTALWLPMSALAFQFIFATRQGETKIDPRQNVK